MLDSAYIEKLTEKRDIEGLISAANNISSDIACKAISALGNIGDHQAVEPLTKLLTNHMQSNSITSTVIKKGIVEALSKIGDVKSAILFSLLIQRGINSDISFYAKEGLKKIGADCIKPLILFGASNGMGIGLEVGWPIAISEVFAEIGTPAVDPIMESLPLAGGLKQQLADVLGEIGDKRAVQPLINHCLEEDFAPIRQSAVVALGKIGDPIATESLIKLLNDKDPSVVREVATALGKIGKLGSVNKIAKLIDDPKIDPGNWSGTKSSLIKALGLIGGPQSVKILISIVSDEKYNAILGARAVAAESLGIIGDKQAIDALEACKNDSTNEPLRNMAKIALEKIKG